MDFLEKVYSYCGWIKKNKTIDYCFFAGQVPASYQCVMARMCLVFQVAVCQFERFLKRKEDIAHFSSFSFFSHRKLYGFWSRPYRKQRTFCWQPTAILSPVRCLFLIFLNLLSSQCYNSVFGAGGAGGAGVGNSGLKISFHLGIASHYIVAQKALTQHSHLQLGNKRADRGLDQSYGCSKGSWDEGQMKIVKHQTTQIPFQGKKNKKTKQYTTMLTALRLWC